MFSKNKRRSGLLHDTPGGSKDASPLADQLSLPTSVRLKIE